MVIEGLSPQGVDNALDYATHPEFDAVDKLVVEYAIAVTNAPQRIRDHVFERLRSHFTEAQIVELTLRIALCGFFNRFNTRCRSTTRPGRRTECAGPAAAARPRRARNAWNRA